MRWFMLLCLFLTVSCKNGEGPGSQIPAAGAVSRPIARQVELQPGAKLPDREMQNPYAGDARAITEGKRLYGWYNCAGCHFNGGGGIGPPLMDEKWIYGSEPANIYDVITEGRPNGMPSYGGRIPEYQLWQIIAYVRSLSSLDGTRSGPKPEQTPSSADVPAGGSQTDLKREATKSSQEPPRQ